MKAYITYRGQSKQWRGIHLEVCRGGVRLRMRFREVRLWEVPQMYDSQSLTSSRIIQVDSQIMLFINITLTTDFQYRSYE